MKTADVELQAWEVRRDTGDGYKSVGRVYTNTAAPKSIAMRKARCLFGNVIGCDCLKFQIVKRR